MTIVDIWNATIGEAEKYFFGESDKAIINRTRKKKNSTTCEPFKYCTYIFGEERIKRFGDPRIIDAFDSSFRQGFFAQDPRRRQLRPIYIHLLNCSGNDFKEIQEQLFDKLTYINKKRDTSRQSTEYIGFLIIKCRNLCKSNAGNLTHDSDLAITFETYANTMKELDEVCKLFVALAFGCIYEFNYDTAIEEILLEQVKIDEIANAITKKFENEDAVENSEIFKEFIKYKAREVIIEIARENRQEDSKKHRKTHIPEHISMQKDNVERYLKENSIDLKNIIKQRMPIDLLKDRKQRFVSDYDNLRIQLRDRIIAWLKSDSSSKRLLEEEVEKLKEENERRKKEAEEIREELEETKKQNAFIFKVLSYLYEQQRDMTTEPIKDNGSLMSQLTRSKDNNNDNEIEHGK